MLAVLDPMPQHVDHAALADLALQPGEELLAGGAIVVELERRQQGRLGRGDEGAQLDKIDGPRPVIGLRVAEPPIVQADERLRLLGEAAAAARRRIRPPGHVGDDEGFQALLRGVGSHAAASQPFCAKVSQSDADLARRKALLAFIPTLDFRQL